MSAALLRLGFVVGVLALALAGPVARAEKADHDKPTNIEYDHSSDDDLHQIYTWTGNVVLTKGTILIRCDKLVVTRDPEGYQVATATMDHPGKRVYFHQKREGYADQWIEGEAERIVYDEKADRVDLFDNAVMRRLDGTALQDQVTGAKIVYHDDTEQYQVEGGGVPGSPRPSMQLAPRSSTGASPGASPSPPVPASAAPDGAAGSRPPSPAAPAAAPAPSSMKLDLSDTLKTSPHE